MTAAPRRLRLVTYAWGERYVETLLQFTLPAVLARGNLPALLAEFPCEFMLLTEQSRFTRVRESRSFELLRSMCPASLVAMDDLVATSAAYGHSLTWALLRGFEDLGEKATETNFLFSNADWIPADGSYRGLIAPLRAGKRLIVAPSYCVSQEAVAPLLSSRLNAENGTLSIAPRELAGMCIRHRHNTVRAKTINQNLFHMNVMDQFYFRVDGQTLLCRQMPIAIVCMCPERKATTPTTFWDYGTVSEYCPTASPHVLAESDDFLMMELRSESTYQEGLKLGPPSSAEVISTLGSFITRDHRDYGRHTLILHGSDLPADLDAKKTVLDRYADDILASLPPPVPHAHHPYWADMRQYFDLIRAAYLETGNPADGAEPKHPPDSAALALKGVDMINRSRIEAARRFFTRMPFSDIAELERARDEWTTMRDGLLQQVSEAGHTANIIEGAYRRTVDALKEEVRRAYMAVQSIDHAIGAAVAESSAGTRWGTNTPKRMSHAEHRRSALFQLIEATSHLRIRAVASPLFTAIRPLLTLLQPYCNDDEQQILTVYGKQGGVCRGLLRELPGQHTEISTSLLMHGSLDTLFPAPRKFALCVCDLGADEAVTFRALCDRLLPLMSDGGKVILLSVHKDALRSRFAADHHEWELVRGLFPAYDEISVYYVGSIFSAAAVFAGRLVDFVSRRSGSEFLRQLLRLAKVPLSALAYCLDGWRPLRSGGRPSRYCTSITVRVALPVADTM